MTTAHDSKGWVNICPDCESRYWVDWYPLGGRCIRRDFDNRDQPHTCKPLPSGIDRRVSPGFYSNEQEWLPPQAYSKGRDPMQETKTKRQPKEKTTSTCWCGCGTNTQSRFAPGHDAKVKGRIARVVALEVNAKVTKLRSMDTGTDPSFDDRVLAHLPELFSGKFAQYA